jgi:prepilin-type N-terminal cleavage/methylation domain-containing protein
MPQSRRLQGFTLVEMLVVISLIVVLMAILFPAFQSAREKARQTKCISNLHQIATELKVYLQDYRMYPPPPFYNTATQTYMGGVCALYPDYINSHDTFICPDDRSIDGVQQAATANHYSSYNGIVEAPQAGKWDFLLIDGTSPGSADQSKPRQRLYNWGGYQSTAASTPLLAGFDDCYLNTTTGVWTLGHDNLLNSPTPAPLPSWLQSQGMGWRYYPRLENRRAPDNTIITHCASHRAFYKSGDEIDPVIRLGGDTSTPKLTDMAGIGATSGVPAWTDQVH